MQTLIENVNIINPMEEIETHQNVLIKDNAIEKISSKRITVKKDVKIIDGEDNYLLPGFIDCHCHILGKGFHKEENMANPLGIHFTMRCLMRLKQSMRALQQLGIADLLI